MVTVTYADIAAAGDRLTGVVRPTPVLTDGRLDARVGASVFCKAECLQTAGAFKFRGASNAIALLSEGERGAGVVTYSSGNHGQAVARAAQRAGSTAVVVMPADAPGEKVAATEAAGARIVFYDRYSGDRVALAARIGAEEGRTVIPPYDHPAVIAGQGTVAVELHGQVPGLHALFVPVGGGGLMAGCALATERLAPGAALYGVEPEAGDDHRRSREAGRRIDIGVPRTIADGQQVSTPGELTWSINNRLVTGFLTVTDDQIRATMGLVWAHLGVRVEPSGATALAAVVHGRVEVRGLRVGVILSGGNIDTARFGSLIVGVVGV